MGAYPKLLIDLRKLELNTKIISDLAKKAGMHIFGVTKATCGDPNVARTMLKGGAEGIADSRIENIIGMKNERIECEFMLLRTPMLGDVHEIVENVDISLNSEFEVISALSKAAVETNKKHKIVLMAEMGDLREGIRGKKLIPMIRRILKLKGIEIYGIGTNLACFGGVVPTEEKMNEFELLVKRIEAEYNTKFDIISGGNSANIPLLLSDPSRGRTNNLRIGEGLLLGLETVNRTPIPGTVQDAFVLEAELIEVKEKPSVPDGEISQNAYGETPVFKDKGDILRGIAAIGRQDVIVEDLTPMASDISILGSSSDHVILHLKSPVYRVGSIVGFLPRYGGLVHLFTSKYVKKAYVVS